MISEPISLWGKGSVTLPKKWRDQFQTTHYMAIEVPEGLLIKPIMDIVYEEYPDGGARLRFPTGIEAGEFLRLWRESGKNLEREERKKKKSKKK
jgi:hypothetical protein